MSHATATAMDMLTPTTAVAAAIVVIASAMLLKRIRAPNPMKKRFGVLVTEDQAPPLPNIPADQQTKSLRNIRAEKQLLTVPAEGVSTLAELFRYAVDTFGSANCFGTRKLLRMHTEMKMVEGKEKPWHYAELGPFEWITCQQAGELVRSFSAGLLQLGIRPGVDNLAIFEETRQEWTIAAHACFGIRVVVTTVYANLGEEGLQHALQQGEIKYLFANGAYLKTLRKLIDKVPTLSCVIYTDQADEESKAVLSRSVRVLSYDELLSLGRGHEGALSAVAPPAPSDVAVVMYTSGSTGAPKGVVITHRNMVAAVAGLLSGLQVRPGDSYLSFLPLAHVLALVVENCALISGVPIGYGNLRTLSDTTVRNCRGDIATLRPTVFAGVPTVYDRIKQNVMAMLAKKPLPVRLLWSVAYGSKSNTVARGGFSSPVWDKLVFSKFRDSLGGRVRLIISGGAPLSVECHEFLRVCFGVPVLQGYGLTETCGGGTLMEMNDFAYGAVGTPVACTQIKLVSVLDMGYSVNDLPNPRGEIWLYGANVTQGYYKDKKRTDEVYFNGWFATGDVGQLLPNGTIQIIDRKKNLIKGQHGEYIAVEKLESIYKNCSLLENVMVYIDPLKYDCVAMAVPAKPALIDAVHRGEADTFAKGDAAEVKRLASEDYGQLCTHPAVRSLVLKSLEAVASKSGLKSIEVTRSVWLCAEPWAPENGLLTAAMKLNRTKIVQMFGADIDAMYRSLQK